MIRQQLFQHQQLAVGQNADIPDVRATSTSGEPERTTTDFSRRKRGTENAYVFFFQKSTTSPGTLIYRCYNCMKQSSKYTGVHVRDGEFLSDPCLLPHNCLPTKKLQDKAERIALESKQNIRKDKNSRRASAQKHWHSTVGSIMRMEWEDDRQRKEVLRRSVRAQQREVNMKVIPEDLQNLPDGSRFLHIKRPDLHLYYSEEVIQKACENGINALIGVHKLNPKTAPLPILYAVTRSKKVQTYRTIFGALKEVLDRYGAPPRLRILLDYEKAAIKAAKATFTESVIQDALSTWRKPGTGNLPF
ncbi:hypothetical protein ANCCAN_24592 [Ancylostoma caninum]|uniref:MULE transposase domain-containing protein n=1 Tax=Ancylostoma caninum TaxID=29170 RepID=A0A368FF53_ANCCA|nr:hypothetical protein ANCCAN_24592 [Ancylostoma caninum]